MPKRKNNQSSNLLINVLAFLAIIISLTSIYLLLFSKNLHLLEEKPTFKLLQSFSQNYSVNYTFVEFPLLAIDENGKGAVTKLLIEVKNGTGKILVNIENLFFWIDTQNSIRVAKELAEKITKVNTSNLDLIYTIEANATLIGGPSAGAAITVATIAALTHKEINRDVVITGTIDEDGNIGKVGGIKEKCEAAKNYGAKICLVPKGQSKEYQLIPKKECTQIGNFEFCKITYEMKEIDISKEVGIKVIEVQNIYEAIKYFFNQ